MKFAKLALTALFISVLGFGHPRAFAETSETLLSPLEPKPLVGEEAMLYKQPFPSCIEVSEGPFCNAYGIDGLRLCYVKIETKDLFVASINEPSQNGTFTGNDCLSRLRIARFLCRLSIEASSYGTLVCLVKRVP